MARTKEQILTKLNVVRRNLAFAEMDIKKNWDDPYKLNITEKNKVTRKIDKLAKESAELSRLTS